LGALVPTAQAGLLAMLPYLLIEFLLILAQAGITQARTLIEHPVAEGASELP
jgi:hypothetical protein